MSLASVTAENIFFKLDSAITLGDDAKLLILIEAGRELDPPVNLLPCYVHLAAKCGHYKVLKLLLDKSLHANGLGAYDAPRYWEYYGDSREAYRSRYSNDRCDDTRLKEGLAQLDTLAGAQQVKRISTHQTGLHVCKDVEIAKLLVERGADVNHADRFGFTPLIEAVFDRNLKLVKCLIELGADVNVGDASDSTALHRAVQMENLELIQLLLDEGASPLARNRRRLSPLDLARNSSQEIFHLLNNKVGPSQRQTLTWDPQVLLGEIAEDCKDFIDWLKNLNPFDTVDDPYPNESAHEMKQTSSVTEHEAAIFPATQSTSDEQTNEPCKSDLERSGSSDIDPHVSGRKNSESGRPSD